MLILFFLLISTHAQARALTCSSLFDTTLTHQDPGLILDKNHGVLNQSDSRLVDAKLVKKNSMLCGPTCVYNVLEKFKIERNEKNFPEKNAEELVQYMNEVFPQNGTDVATMVKEGTTIGDLSHSLQVIAKQNNLNLKTRIKTTVSLETADIYREHGLSLSEIKNSIGPGRTAIVMIGYYNTGNLLKVTKTNRLGGHFMIVAGHDPINPNQLIFQDPNRPLSYRKVNVLPVKPSNFTKPTYELDMKVTPWWYPREVTTLIERVLFIEEIQE